MTKRDRFAHAARLTLVSLAASCLAFPAYAQTTIGDRLQAGITDMVGPILFVITMMSTLGGVFLFVKGLMKLKDASTERSGLSGSLMTLLAATMLIALPEVAGIGMSSVMGGSGLIGRNDFTVADRVLDGDSAASRSGSPSSKLAGMASVTAPDNCLSATGTSSFMGNNSNGGAVPCMARNLAKNVVPIGVIAVFGFVFLAGLWTFGSALYELARSHGQEGRGTPPGWWGKVLASVLMMNGPPFFMAVTRTIMGNEANTVGASGVNTGSSLLTYNISGVSVLTQYTELIGHLFTILVLFGVLAFVKGIFVIKSASERQGNATFSHGVVFMVAGVLLANSKLSTCTILSTIAGGGNAGLLGFCN